MDTDELAFLRATPCFQGLRTEDLLLLYRNARRREPRAGEVILYAGQRIDMLYVVRRGYVRLFTMQPGSTERVHSIQGPGTIFNEVAVCDGGPALTIAQAFTADTCIYEIPATLVFHLLADNPRLGHNLAVALAKRIRRLAALAMLDWLL